MKLKSPCMNRKCAGFRSRLGGFIDDARPYPKLGQPESEHEGPAPTTRMSLRGIFSPPLFVRCSRAIMTAGSFS
jgi:hypothetical protein